jgi:hypothetical protein
LLEDRLVIARAAAPWKRRSPEVLMLPLEPQLAPPQGAAQPPAWQPAVTALSAWLAQQQQPGARLHIVLSARFVRWQLLAWQPQLKRPEEWAAYALLRFRHTYGASVDGWRLAYPDPQPGQAVPVSATDVTLLEALQAMAAAHNAQIAQVTPYFSAAFDRWRKRLGRHTAWFGVVEPGHISLCLINKGVWHGLRSVRQTGEGTDWQAVLSPLQAQMGVASGLSFEQEPPLFLAGCSGAPALSTEPGLTWLAPASEPTGAASLNRMAWGV